LAALANNLSPEKSTATKTPEPMEEGRGGGQNAQRVLTPVDKMEVSSAKVCNIIAISVFFVFIVLF
jgi:hypothetical protein